MDDKAGSVGKYQDDDALHNDALRNEPAKNQDDKKTVSLEKQSTDALRNDALRMMGTCEHCGVEYTKRVTWQKYHDDNCRQAAYELRTGKAWHGKKVHN